MYSMNGRCSVYVALMTLTIESQFLSYQAYTTKNLFLTTLVNLSVRYIWCVII